LLGREIHPPTIEQSFIPNLYRASIVFTQTPRTAIILVYKGVRPYLKAFPTDNVHRTPFRPDINEPSSAAIFTYLYDWHDAINLLHIKLTT
jgi:hypothetical protein